MWDREKKTQILSYPTFQKKPKPEEDPYLTGVQSSFYSAPNTPVDTQVWEVLIVCCTHFVELLLLLFLHKLFVLSLECVLKKKWTDW